MGVLCAVLFALYCLVLAFARDFFALAIPNAGIVMCSLVGSAIAIAGLAMMDERFVPSFLRRGSTADTPVP